MRTKVYIAGPLTNGNMSQNVHNAMKVMDDLLQKGYAPFCPHLFYWQNLAFYRAPQFWLEYDFEWLKVCDALLRIPGYSPGSEEEEKKAIEFGIPVFRTIEELEQWSKG